MLRIYWIDDIISPAMRVAKPIQNLIDEFQKLPGIGPRTAERLTYHLLRAPRENSTQLADAVARLKTDTVECQTCFNIGDRDPCMICMDEQRDKLTIMVVEEPLDLIAIEKTGKYEGVYHVLGGVLNPISGIGPESLRIEELMGRLGEIREVILATNPSTEGETTAMFLGKKIREMETGGKGQGRVKITRIARGLPTGADVEYADSITLARALEGRTEFK